MTSTSNPVLTDVPTAYNALPVTGNLVDKFSNFDTGITAHIQGMAQYKNFVLFTHNRANSVGYWGIGDYSNGSFSIYDFPDFADSKGEFRHPGGFQVIGDIAVCGIEHSESDNTEGMITLFDLSNLSDSQGPVSIPNGRFTRTNGGAACVGIVAIQNYYVLAVYTSLDQEVHIYQSNNVPLTDPSLDFGTELFSFKVTLPDGTIVGYDNLNLQTDTSGGIFLIGMRGETSGISIADFSELIQIDMSNQSGTVLASRHMYTTNNYGIVGPHFRWGAGTTVVDPQTLRMFCSSRLFMALPTKTQMNFFPAL